MKRFAPWAALAAVPATAAAGFALFLDGPPPGHTGGFGERTCVVCHADFPEPDTTGRVVVLGVPDRYAPGARYLLRVRVLKPGLRHAGFQLSAREEHGVQAGRLRTTGERTRVSVHEIGRAHV